MKSLHAGVSADRECFGVHCWFKWLYLGGAFMVSSGVSESSLKRQSLKSGLYLSAPKRLCTVLSLPPFNCLWLVAFS